MTTFQVLDSSEKAQVLEALNRQLVHQRSQAAMWHRQAKEAEEGSVKDIYFEAYEGAACEVDLLVMAIDIFSKCNE